MKKFKLLLLAAVTFCIGWSAGAQTPQSGYFDDYLRRYGGIIYSQYPGMGIPDDRYRVSLKGDVAKVTEYVNSASSPTSVRTFDTNGYILSETFIPRGKKEPVEIEYKYDYDNSRLESITVRTSGREETHEVRYEADGTISGMEYQSDGLLGKYIGSRYRITYGVFAALPMQVAGVENKDEFYSYMKGLPFIEEYDTEISGVPAKYSFRYTYTDGIKTGHTLDTYKPGTEQPLVIRSGGDTYTATTAPESFKHTFDNKGNWTEQAAYIFGSSVDRREIQYYPPERTRPAGTSGGGNSDNGDNTGNGGNGGGNPGNDSGDGGAGGNIDTPESGQSGGTGGNGEVGGSNASGGGRNTPGGAQPTGPALDCEVILSQSARQQPVSDYIWNGSSSASMPGRGTREEPYLVTSTHQLACIAMWTRQGYNLKGQYFVLMTDMDLTNEHGNQDRRNWEPIGNEKTPFAGHFYGNGHTIKNMSIVEVDKKRVPYGGVFGYIAPEGSVRDLTVDSSCTVKAETAGAIAAFNYGTLTECTVAASVGGEVVGGIAGVNNGTISGCISTADVDVVTDGGGIAGKSKGLVEKCAFRGSVIFFSLADHSGGIVGYLLAGGRIEDCYSRGKITANIVSVTASSGGIAGNKSLPENSSITNCYSAGKGGRGGHIMANLTRSIDKVTNCWFDLTVKPLTKSEKKNQNFYLENGGSTTEQMKGPDFVATMNAGRADGPWTDDTENLNNGYPILRGVETMRPVYICDARQYMVSTGADKLIHKNGVGLMYFGHRNPQLGDAYTTNYQEDDEFGNRYYCLDKNGDLVAEYFPEYLMVVYSDEFRTQDEGIRVGMTFGEVKQRVKGYKPQLIAHGGTGQLYVQFNPDMVFSLAGAHLKGGQAQYDEWWFKGTELTIDDVSDDAIVLDIRVRNE